MSTRVVCLEKFEALDDLAPAWGEILESLGGGNLFLSHHWLTKWREVYRHGVACRLLVASEGGRPVAILPLVKGHGRGGARRLSFMGGGEVAPNHLDVIARPADRARAAEAFCDHLWQTRREWDVLDLESVADDSPLRAAVAERLAPRCDSRVTLYTRCLFAALPESFEEFIQSRGQQTRAEYRRKGRKLLRDVPVIEFGVVKDGAQLPEMFDTLVRLHQARWTSLGERGVFASEPFTAFHRAASLDGLRRGELRLYYLRVGTDVAATYYCYRVGGRVYFYAGGFDERFKTHSVGIQLLGYAIEQSIAEGATDFDFLQGDEGYKEHWATGHRDNWRITVAAPHWRGRLAGWSASAGETLHGLWRKHVPMNTRRAVKKYLQLGRRPLSVLI